MATGDLPPSPSPPPPPPPAGSLHAKVSPFFKRKPRDWALHAYLAFRHDRSRSPRYICNGWKASLRQIQSCMSTCCTYAHRTRAGELLARYEEKGSGSDRAFAKKWLQNKEKKGAEPAHAQTIHFGPVYNAEVGAASVTQTYNGPLATAGAVRAASPFSDVPHIEDSGEDYAFDGEENYASDIEEDEGDGGGSTFPLPSNPISSIPDTPAPTLPAKHSTAAAKASATAARASTASTEAASKHALALAALSAAYNSQTPSHRWHLASSRAVETVLYESCLAMDASSFLASLAPSFILDVSDTTTMRDWFTGPEWQEIMSAVPDMPTADTKMVKSLVRFFTAKTTADVREVLATKSFLDEGESYDREKHFDACWADLVVRLILGLWECPNDPLRASHMEDWYTSYLWSPIVDQCLLSLTDITIERKEAPCRASAERRNRNRTINTRTRIGPRLDAVIRTVEDDTHEYGGMEIARSYSGQTSSKWIGDTFKLAKALRDMLHRLHERVDHDEHVTRKLQVVGVFCAGLKIQTVRMGCWKGGVAVLIKDPVMEVPVAIEGMAGLCKVIAGVQRMKMVVQECVHAVTQRHQARSQEDLINELLYGPKQVGARLERAPDTP